MTLNLSSGALGAAYTVHTDEIEGVSFSAIAILDSAGSMTITLYGIGTPIITNEKVFTISTNSTLSPTSTATVMPVIAAKKAIVILQLLFFVL